MEQEVEARKELIIKLLESTEREGMQHLLEYLCESDFFEAPASTRFHGCIVGGLAHHSLKVYQMLVGFDKQFDLHTPKDSLIIGALCHDLCKINKYIKSAAPGKWHWNKQDLKGHAALSLVRIATHIVLTDLEIDMIRYHMGVWGLNEFDPMKGEYNLRGGGMIKAWVSHKIVRLVYFCDELVTYGE